MSFDVTEVEVNVHSRELWNSVSGVELLGSSVPRLFYKESMIFGVSFVEPDGTPITEYVAGDQFEMSIDVDFSHVVAYGVLANAYSGAVTSIEITFADDPGDIDGVGELTLRNDDYQRENVPYTAISGSGLTRTFTVSKTLSFSYEAGDFAGVEDKLMVRVDDTDVDISGDWSATDRATGKVSFRLDCSRYEFLRKLAVNGLNSDNELEVNYEIKRYPDGETSPTVLCQDTIFCRNIVRDLEN